MKIMTQKHVKLVFIPLTKHLIPLVVSGGLAAGIPAEVKGLHKAWETFGRTPWTELFEPTIRLCENGAMVLPALASIISMYSYDLLKDPHLRSRTFFNLSLETGWSATWVF